MNQHSRLLLVSIVGLVGLAALGVIAFRVLIVVLGFIFSSGRPTSDVAVYADMSFSGTRNEKYDSFHTGGTSNIALVFVRLPNNTVAYLPTLVPDDVREMSMYEIPGDGDQVSFRSAAFYFWFDGETLVNAYIEDWQIGLSKEGKFYSLPISHSDMVEAFGEPQSYRKSVSGAP